jgi:tetratricopeptide (TPR) repeat protein
MWTFRLVSFSGMPLKRFHSGSILDKVDASLVDDRKWIILLFVFSFILKLIYIVQSADSLALRVPILDAQYYDDMAKSIAAGQFIQKEAFFMGPLYPYFVAFVYGIFGRNLMLLRAIQILGGSATVVLTYLIGKRIFRPSVALLGAVMLVLYGAGTYYEGQLLMEWLGTLLDMLLLYVLFRDFGKYHVLKFVLAGFLLGLSSLARANILIFAPVVLIWILHAAKEKKRFVYAAAFIAGALVTISPATIHNYVVSKDAVLITWNGGMNFYIGNSEEATGAFVPIKGVDPIRDMSTERYVEQMVGRDMKPSEVSSYWLTRAWMFIKEHPGNELKLLFRKMALFFNGFEIPQIESYDLSKINYGIFKVLFVNFWMLCSLGLAGMIFSAWEWRRRFLLYGFIISYSVSIILFFVTARYRIQIAPAISLFAAFSAAEVLPRSFATIRRAFLTLATFGILIFLTWPGLFDIDMNYIRWREHIHEGRQWSMLGETDKALAEINRAIALRPDDAESYIHRAIIYKDSGKPYEAIEDYTRSLRISPVMPGVHYDLAQVLRRARMYPAAADEYLRAIAQDSLMVEAYNGLGITYQLMKNPDSAIRCFRRAIRINPGHTKAYSNLGAALAESGDVDGAISCFREAIEREPSYAHSYKNLAMAYIAKNRLLEAKKNMEQYLELMPNDTGAAEVLQRILAAIEADTIKGDSRHK